MAVRHKYSRFILRTVCITGLTALYIINISFNDILIKKELAVSCTPVNYLAQNTAKGKEIKKPSLRYNKQIYSYYEMIQDIDSLVKAHTGKIQKRIIGKSVLGRDIPVIILGNPQAPKKIAVIGSIHGREYIGTQLIMKQMEFYLNNPMHSFNQVYIVNQLQRVCIYFIPMLNPDGVMLSQAGLNSVKNQKMKNMLLKLNKGSHNFKSWKANARGVDLNRNFNAGWKKIQYMPAGPEAYKGPYPLSEPESWAVANYISKRNFNAVLTYHSAGQVVYWYYFQKGSSYNRDRKIADAIAYTTGYKLPPKGNKVSSGGLKDWYVQNYGRPGFTIELGEGESPLPFSQFSSIWKKNRYIPLLISQQV
ncbi:gamma-D-glutamyl-L-diamino acid endopeptidase 1 [Oxobacter pfennigii]|uniref:Gamma-D-glutamyl-L-diamino acid endopeptidase 1 n=2 Tax=Oxobacter pfennigii TaxID=36849 RepID=A0A0P8W7Z2_9CLOT|nr:gamma-D-glutamyl-L-diamino acid endopeptidase 1 [Oxobacter pfennigii]